MSFVSLVPGAERSHVILPVLPAALSGHGAPAQFEGGRQGLSTLRGLARPRGGKSRIVFVLPTPGPIRAVIHELGVDPFVFTGARVPSIGTGSLSGRAHGQAVLTARLVDM